MSTLPPESVHCVVTSPPYWGLRNYGIDRQVGLETQPEDYIAGMVEVFREVRRVLRADGTVWLNLGDSYATNGTEKSSGNKRETRAQGMHNGFKVTPSSLSDRQAPIPNHRPRGLKAKDLVGIPWHVAFALQEDGWYLRADIVWSKPNPMPESVNDRPTKAHEFVFLLAKSKRYFYDAAAIREKAKWERWGDQTVPKYEGTKTKTGWMQPQTKAELKRKTSVHRSALQGGQSLEEEPSGSRNKRSVWHIPTVPFVGAHFATFPPKLVRPCIMAGTSAGCCPDCGTGWISVVEADAGIVGSRPLCACYDDRYRRDFARPRGRKRWQREISGNWWKRVRRRPGLESWGYRPAAVVLDPFAGAGTTNAVARNLGRASIAIELNPDYAAMILKQVAESPPPPPRIDLPEQLELADVRQV